MTSCDVRVTDLGEEYHSDDSLDSDHSLRIGDGEGNAEHIRTGSMQSQRSKGKSSILARIIKFQCYTSDNLVITTLGGVLLLVLLWTVLYILLPKEVIPSGDLFKLIGLVVLAYVVGLIVTLIKLPALLGMLLTGVCLKSVGVFEISGVYETIVAVSRDVALAVILIKAGLGLDAVALRRLSITVLKLALFPCIAEGIAAAVIGHFVVGLPWLWGLLLGFLLSPVSPAVVVPTLLSLKERGYGEDKGIATLVIAASSVDDIASISMFGIFLAMIFSSGGNLTEQILQGPLELVMGLAAGIVWGLVLAFLPNRHDKFLAGKRTLMLGGGGLIAVLGSKSIGFSGGGPLACVTAAFVAGFAWKTQSFPLIDNSVGDIYSGIWILMQPILFGLIGTEIDVTQLQGSNVGSGLIIIILGLLVRIAVCFLMLIGSKLTWKEIIFVNLAWLPKATVQAALSPQALDLVRKEPNPCEDDLDRATLLVTTAVLAILLTAPLGSVAISLSGPRLLAKKEDNTNQAVTSL